MLSGHPYVVKQKRLNPAGLLLLSCRHGLSPAGGRPRPNHIAHCSSLPTTSVWAQEAQEFSVTKKCWASPSQHFSLPSSRPIPSCSSFLQAWCCAAEVVLKPQNNPKIPGAIFCGGLPAQHIWVLIMDRNCSDGARENKFLLISPHPAQVWLCEPEKSSYWLLPTHWVDIRSHVSVGRMSHDPVHEGRLIFLCISLLTDDNRNGCGRETVNSWGKCDEWRVWTTTALCWFCFASQIGVKQTSSSVSFDAPSPSPSPPTATTFFCLWYICDCGALMDCRQTVKMGFDNAISCKRVYTRNIWGFT